MNRYRLFSVAPIALLVFICSFSQHGRDDQKWIELFNGRHIRNWIVKVNHHDVGVNFGNTFRVEDGMIKVRYDQYGAYNDQFAHLYFKRPFSHYHLLVEYRFAGQFKQDAPPYTIRNSGVMLHSQDPRTMLKDQDWPISIEMQFLGGLGDGNPRPTGNLCTPGTEVEYEGKLNTNHCIDSKSKTYEGDQWVTAEAIVLGDSIIMHIINGDTVLTYSKPRIGGGVVTNYDPAIKVDGTPLKKGFIALQSEGQEIDFRRVAIRILKR